MRISSRCPVTHKVKSDFSMGPERGIPRGYALILLLISRKVALSQDHRLNPSAVLARHKNCCGAEETKICRYIKAAGRLAPLGRRPH